MLNNKVLHVFIFAFVISEVICDSVTKETDANGVENRKQYGEHFSKAYFEVDGHIPTSDDLNTYLLALYKMGSNLVLEPNETDPSSAIGSFFAHGTLTRTLLDYGDKLDKDQVEYLKYIIKCFDYYISHFAYMNLWRQRYYYLTNEDVSFAISKIFAADVKLLAHSLPAFSRGKLKPWILSRYTTDINNFTESMNTASLSRKEYIYELLESVQNNRYHIYVNESDRCLLRLSYNRAPALEDETLRPCQPNVRCQTALYKSPSIAYSLSHRQIQLLMYRFVRRCYFVSPEADLRELHMMCAAMYREAVYIAKKGFFARDMFIEHAGLCGMVGYEEFHRRSWFYKAASWVDSEGCVRENKNFIRYRYTYDHNNCDQNNKKYLWQVKYWYRKNLVRQCNTHLLAVSVVFLSNGVRHAAHHIAKQKSV